MRGKMVGLVCGGLLASAVGIAAAEPPATAPASPAQATMVTLHVKNVTRRQALEDLAKQTNLMLEGEGPKVGELLDDARVSVDLEKQPLWSALVAICDAAGVRPVRFTPNAPGLLFGNQDGGWNARLTDVHGGFAVGVVRVEQELRINYASPGNGFPPSF